MINQEKEVSIQNWLMLILLALIWGSSFILIKKALTVMEPVQLACFRIAITCIAFIPYTIYIRHKLDWSRWLKFLLVGLTTTGIPSFCFAFAQKYVTSATAGILNSLTPIFALLVSVLVFKAKFQISKLAGVVLGFIGAGILVYKSGDGHLSGSITGSIIILIATICYGFNSNLVKEFFSDIKPIEVTAGAFTLVGLPAVLYLLFNKSTYTLLANPANYSGLLAVTTLSLMCTLVANLLFYDLIQKTNAVFSSTVTFLIPLVAALWGIWDGEALNIYHLISMLCILGALFILRRKG
jgi:drug/metabolite transporter (DMT)-like permease